MTAEWAAARKCFSSYTGTEIQRLIDRWTDRRSEELPECNAMGSFTGRRSHLSDSAMLHGAVGRLCGINATLASRM